MRVRVALLGSLLYGFAVVAAAPAPNAVPSPSCQKGCQAVNDVIQCLRGPELRRIATAFCSAYLHYPSTIASTVTVSPTVTRQSTLPDVTQTSIVPVTQGNVVTETITSIAPAPTVVVTVTEDTATRTVYQKKRGLEKEKKRSVSERGLLIPVGLGKFPAARISSACSCIVTPSTTTVVRTATASAATVVQTVGPQHTIVVTQTVTIQVTSTADVTITLQPTNTIDVTVTVDHQPDPSAADNEYANFY